jgi:hypothetical protein
MEKINRFILEYGNQLHKGHIQRAYKGIMTFMSNLSIYLVNSHREFSVSALYPGYMDMTYFAFTPPDLKIKNLKIAIVYLHEQNRFEAWLSGGNRKIQAEYIKLLSYKDTKEYKLSQVLPGVDSIIESTLVDQPDFDNSEELKKLIDVKIIEFTNDMRSLLA